MSQKQIEKQHGPVESWNLTKFYSWEEFKKMPVDLQAEYINRLIDTYHVGIRYISSHLFGKGAATLDNHTRRFGYEKKIHACQRGVNKEAHQAFLSAIEDSRREAFAEEEEKEQSEVEELYDKAVSALKQYSENGIEEPEAEDPIFRHDVSYVSSSVRVGLDIDELAALAAMFQNKKVFVDLKITVL